jgi:DNA-binding MarR family transcriptional regulator
MMLPMQEATTISPFDSPWDMLSGQSLVALLALVGTRRMDVGALRRRTKLTQHAFGNLLSWLQREYLVDVVSNLNGDAVEEKVELTEKGEAVLVSMLEKTCELPEFR